MKTCSKCKIEKPFEAFWRSKAKPDGYVSSCIECINLRKLELKKNPLMQLEKQIRSSIKLENKLLKRENKRLCDKCKEIFLIDDLVSGVSCKECSIVKIKENNEKYKEKKREYREKRIEQKKEYGKKYYEKNKEKLREEMKERSKRHYEKNKDKRKEQNRQYRLKKKLEKEKENKIDPKEISALMEKLNNIKE